MQSTVYRALSLRIDSSGSKVEITEIYLPAVNTPQFNWCKNNMPRMPRPLPPVFEPNSYQRIFTGLLITKEEIFFWGITLYWQYG
jgi:hypothetical protein